MADPSHQQSTTISLPSLLLFLLLLAFTLRYFFFSSSSSPTSSSNNNTRRVPWSKIETLTTMFPQLRARDVEYDLLRNGGSVQDTSERVLREGGLGVAPPSFRAQTPPPSSSASLTGAASTSTRNAQSQRGGQPAHQDLITRYNLASKLAKGKDRDTSGSGVAAGAGPAEEAGAGEGIQTADAQRRKGTWSSSKLERAELLRRRREEMVLGARRRMEERDREGGK